MKLCSKHSVVHEGDRCPVCYFNDRYDKALYDLQLERANLIRAEEKCEKLSDEIRHLEARIEQLEFK